MRRTRKWFYRHLNAEQMSALNECYNFWKEVAPKLGFNSSFEYAEAHGCQ